MILFVKTYYCIYAILIISISFSIWYLRNSYTKKKKIMQKKNIELEYYRAISLEFREKTEAKEKNG